MMRPPKVLMNAEMTIEPLEGESAYGPVYGDPIEEVDAYVEPKRRKVTDDEGNEVIAEIFAVIRDDINIPTGSKGSWDWDPNNAEYEVIKAIPFRPLGHFSHIEVYMK